MGVVRRKRDTAVRDAAAPVELLSVDHPTWASERATRAFMEAHGLLRRLRPLPASIVGVAPVTRYNIVSEMYARHGRDSAVEHVDNFYATMLARGAVDE